MKWVYERSGVLANREKRFQLIRNILEVLSLEFDPTANVGWLSNRIINSIHEFVYPFCPYYEGLKLQSNKLAEDLLKSAKFYRKGQITSGEVSAGMRTIRGNQCRSHRCTLRRFQISRSFEYHESKKSIAHLNGRRV